MRLRMRGLFAAGLLLLAAPAEAAPEIVEVTSPGGITAWLAEDHTVPIVALDADVLGGTALDPEGREGVMALMAGLLTEGAGEREATAFAAAAGEIGAGFSLDAVRDAIHISAQMLAESTGPAVALLADALQAPRFDAEPFARVRNAMQANLAQEALDPDSVASRAAAAALFPDHPYGRSPTPASLDAIGAADLRAAWRSGLVRDRLTVAVAGAISPEALAPLLDRLFAELPLSDRPLPGPVVPRLGGGVAVVGMDAPQSVIRFAQPGIALDDPDLLPAMVLDQIVGGGFGSRLTSELRERRGLTYGVATWLDTDPRAPLYAGGLSTANGTAAEAVRLVREAFARIAADGVTEAELADAKRFLTGAYPLRFVGTEAMAGQLLGIQRAGLGRDYPDRRNALVEAVTAADVARVARRIIRPGSLTFLVVGRPEGLE